MKKILFSWSGGKDSALALWELLSSGSYQVKALLTTVTEEYDRISMHGVRRELLEKQAAAIGIPMEPIFLKQGGTNAEYDTQLQSVLLKYRNRFLNTVAFGDLFLHEVRAYREEQLSRINMKALFPLWDRKTLDIARGFIRAGFKAIITCVDTQLLDASFCGREYNEQLLADLPTAVDPCGENGEFHTFVHDGPIFTKPVLFSIGEMVMRDNQFRFCDLVAA
jgi:uncharacterized protein (TIGR00290 family)